MTHPTKITAEPAHPLASLVLGLLMLVLPVLLWCTARATDAQDYQRTAYITPAISQSTMEVYR